MKTSHITPVNQRSTVVRLSVSSGATVYGLFFCFFVFLFSFVCVFVFVVLFAFVFVALFCFDFLFCLCFFLEWWIWMGTLIRKNTGVSRGGGGGVGLWIIISAGLINWEVFWFGWGGGGGEEIPSCNLWV